MAEDKFPESIIVQGEEWKRVRPFRTPSGLLGYVYENPRYIPVHIPPLSVKTVEDVRDWIRTMRTKKEASFLYRRE